MIDHMEGHNYFLVIKYVISVAFIIVHYLSLGYNIHFLIEKSHVFGTVKEYFD